MSLAKLFIHQRYKKGAKAPLFVISFSQRCREFLVSKYPRVLGNGKQETINQTSIFSIFSILSPIHRITGTAIELPHAL